MSKRHNDALTGLRAVAAVMVVISHAAFWTGNYSTDTLGYIFARLEVGVPIFFVLSGYLLFKPWAAVADSGRPAPALGHYLHRRARRILPSYWIVVIVVYLVYLGRDAGPFGGGWDGFLRNMTLTQIYGYGHLHVSLTQMWSLAVEVAFYLVLPGLGWLIIVGLCRRRRRPWVASAALTSLIALSVAWIVVTHSDWFYDAVPVDITAQLWLPSFLGWFAGGMLLAVIAPRIQGRGGGWLTVGSLAGAAALFTVACTGLAGEPTIMPFDVTHAVTKSLLYLAIATLLMLPLVAGTPTWYSRALSWRPMVWLGEISYELFLVHLLVMEFVMELLGFAPFTGNWFGLFEITLMASVPLAWGLHRLTMRPGARRHAAKRHGTGPGDQGPVVQGQPVQTPVAANSSSTAVDGASSMPSAETQASSK